MKANFGEISTENLWLFVHKRCIKEIDIHRKNSGSQLRSFNVIYFSRSSKTGCCVIEGRVFEFPYCFLKGMPFIFRSSSCKKNLLMPKVLLAGTLRILVGSRVVLISLEAKGAIQ